MYILCLFEAVYISHDLSLEKKGLECCCSMMSSPGCRAEIRTRCLLCDSQAANELTTPHPFYYIIPFKMWEGISAEASTCVVVSVTAVVVEVVAVVKVVADRLTVLQSTPKCSWHSPEKKQGMKRDKFCKLIVFLYFLVG